jgi:hypothetical protein
MVTFLQQHQYEKSSTVDDGIHFFVGVLRPQAEIIAICKNNVLCFVIQVEQGARRTVGHRSQSCICVCQLLKFLMLLLKLLTQSMDL